MARKGKFLIKLIRNRINRVVKKHYNTLKSIEIKFENSFLEVYITLIESYVIVVKVNKEIFILEELIKESTEESLSLSLKFSDFKDNFLNSGLRKFLLELYKKALNSPLSSGELIIKRNWKRVGIYTIEQIFDGIRKDKEQNKKVNRRLNVFFVKGLKCSNPECQREGTYFALEIDEGGGKHMDLFTSDNILMTVDHHRPRSKGGKWNIENTNPMCQPCNSLKADKMEEEEIEKVLSSKDV